MPADLYCRVMGEEIGPISSGQLRAMAQAGKILPDSLIKRGEGGEWVPADRVKGLFEPASLDKTARLSPVLPPKIAFGARPALARAHVLSEETACDQEIAIRKHRLLFAAAGVVALLIATAFGTAWVASKSKKSTNPPANPDEGSVPKIVVESPPAPVANDPATERPSNKPPSLNPAIFTRLRQAALQIEGSVSLKPTYQEFRPLVQGMATEFVAAGDEARTDEEKSILKAYSNALDAYKDSMEIWETAISVHARVPDLETEHRELMRTIVQGKRAGVDDPRTEKILTDRDAEVCDDLSWLSDEQTLIPIGVADLKTDVEPIITRQSLQDFILHIGRGHRTWFNYDKAIGHLWKKAAKKLSEAGKKAGSEQ